MNAPFFRCCLLLAGLLAGGRALAVVTPDLDTVTRLIKGGASQLALTFVDRGQHAGLDPEQWLRWERARLAIYRAQRAWPAIVQRAERAGGRLPEPLAAELWLAGARAELAAGNGAGARRLLRRLLWRDGVPAAATVPWRELVVRSYLVDDAVGDASIAMGLFEKEFRPDSAAFRHLYARILLRAGEPEAAATQVATLQTYEGRWLHALAGLRSGQDVRGVIAALRKLAAEAAQDPAMRERAWGAIAEAAVLSGDYELRVRALERALPLDEPLLPLSVEDLWQAWERHGESLGNANQLLIGNDAPWLKLAGALQKKKSRSSLRAVYAVLALNGESADSRAQAHQRLLDSLLDNRFVPLAIRLYDAPSRFASVAEIPAVVRYRLAELALKRDDVREAARLTLELDEAPAGNNADGWRLRRARLAIISGDRDKGVALIEQVLTPAEELDKEAADALLQPVFDLQAVGESYLAYGFFERIHAKVKDVRLKRETLYWMAESRQAQGKDRAAAELYLRSATWAKSDSTDLWGQSARYAAAEALNRAGLREDAQTIFLTLREQTRDPKRRAALQRKIQQLWLLGPATAAR